MRPPFHRYCSACGHAIARSCVSCAAPLAPDDAYCGGCGADLAPPVPDASTSPRSNGRPAPASAPARTREAPPTDENAAFDIEEILLEVAALASLGEADRSTLEQGEIDDLFAKPGESDDDGGESVGRGRGDERP
jgi:hypothetical protein